MMSGLVHIKTPHSGLPHRLNEVYVEGGRTGWILAADTADVADQGHITSSPGLQPTVIAQSTIKGNKPPEHSVLHNGPCLGGDLAGL